MSKQHHQWIMGGVCAAMQEPIEERLFIPGSCTVGPHAFDSVGIPFRDRLRFDELLEKYDIH